MKYRQFIEDFFLIDESDTEKLVPFKFNKVQEAYYAKLCEEYDIENKGVAVAMREQILKARREGFSSLILALFAADDITSPNPTNTLILSYKDDATKVFRQRYKEFVLSYFKKRFGVTNEKQIFKVNDDAEKVFAHNGARFYCGTASARVGERGGVVHNLLFSEAAYYPDLEKLTVKEIVEGTLRQVDIKSGWVFIESTGNGEGNYYAELWHKAMNRESRFRPRFFSWKEFYSPEEFETIKSEFLDEDSLKREYPETPDDALVSRVTSFTNREQIDELCTAQANKRILGWLELRDTNYISQAEIIKYTLEQLELNHPDKDFYVGVDVAKSNDSTVVTLLYTKTSFGGMNGIKCVTVDATGAGDFLPDWFEQNTRWYINRVKLTAVQNDIMYKLLRQTIQGKLTALPELNIAEGRIFLKQMLELRVELTGKGDLISVHATNGENYHDDFPDSWALAELGYSQLKGMPEAQKPAPRAGRNIQTVVSDMLTLKHRKVRIPESYS